MDIDGSGTPEVAVRSAPGAGHSLRSAGRSVAFVLDVIIAIYVIALLVVLTTGGVDLGVVTLTEASKPVLVLLILLPLRITIGHRFWPLDVARRSAQPAERLTALARSAAATVP